MVEYELDSRYLPLKCMGVAVNFEIASTQRVSLHRIPKSDKELIVFLYGIEMVTVWQNSF